MKSAAEILRGFGLPPLSEGHHYVICPKCSHARTVAHRKAKCLGVTIDHEGVRFSCNHCGWTDGAYYNGKTNGRDRDPIVATYEYVDESGTVLFRKVRTAGKKFWQERSDHGAWIKGLANCRRVLYALPEVIEAIGNDRAIFVVEGEKDCDNLRKLGVPATCNSEGASEPNHKPKWRTEYSETLKGAEVILIPDNDAPGVAHTEAIASALNGVAKSVRVLNLVQYWLDCPAHGDISDWLAAGHTREDFDALVARAKPWTQNGDDPAPEAQLADLEFIDISNWDEVPAPRREWAVKDRIPLRQPTLFSGEGAIGKTLIALQLCAAHVVGRDCLGMLPEPGAAIYVGAEDESDELHRRLADIAAHYGIRFADLAGGLNLLSFAGKDAILGTVGRDGIVRPTALFERLYRAACQKKPKLIVLDTVSDIFVGNENDRAQVRQFVALLRHLAIDANAGVLVNSHPSLTGISTGTGLSGSTGWHNSVRARMYLSGARTDDGDEPDPDLRQIEFLKNNYGPKAERILLRWRNGVFVLEPGVGSLEKAAADAKAENVFLELLIRFNKQGRNVSDKSGKAYAPSLFADEQEAKAARIKKGALADAMRRLFASDRIHLENYGRPSRPSFRLVPGPAP